MVVYKELLESLYGEDCNIYIFFEMHIGQRIRSELEKQGKTVVWFAGELSCHRTNVYKIFSKSYIDTHDLMRISKILDYDFFQEYSALLKKDK